MSTFSDLDSQFKTLKNQYNNKNFVSCTRTIKDLENSLLRLHREIVQNFDTKKKDDNYEYKSKSYKEHEKELKQILNNIKGFRDKCPEDLYFYTFVSSPEQAKEYINKIESMPRQTKKSEILSLLLTKLKNNKAFYSDDIFEDKELTL